MFYKRNEINETQYTSNANHSFPYLDIYRICVNVFFFDTPNLKIIKVKRRSHLKRFASQS